MMYRVDVEKMIKDDGIELIRKDLGDKHAGYIVYNKYKKKFIIVINQNHGIRRQRFTMTHEYAHSLLHRKELMERGSLDKNF